MRTKENLTQNNFTRQVYKESREQEWSAGLNVRKLGASKLLKSYFQVEKYC